jgi:Protein of unknown function (DUF2510)
MNLISHSIIATVSCTKSSTSGAIIGFVIILAIVGAVVILAVANSRAHSRLAAANAELNYLRPENDRLQQWISALSGTPASDPAPRVEPAGTSADAQWYADPSGRHEGRYWNGIAWTDDVWDQGVTSKDPNR